MEKHRNLDFTEIAEDRFRQELKDLKFRSDKPEDNAEAIAEALINELDIPKFSDYLKRYICRKQNRVDEYANINEEEYLQYIVDTFNRSDTPASFDSEKTNLQTAAKNWLSRKAVSRKNVFLLGLGLGMKTEEVNEFLTKGIYEQEINPKDPFEAICWYCFQYCTEKYQHYNMYKALWEKYLALPANPLSRSYSHEETGIMWIRLEAVKSEEDLFHYLKPLKFDKEISTFSITAYKKFKDIYTTAKERVAEIEEISVNEVTEVLMENYLYGGLYKAKSGNLPKEKMSDFYEIFVAKRLSRQRLGRLLDRKCQVERFDLITLKFLELSIDYEVPYKEQNLNEERREWFEEETNQILEECFMHKIIIQNPYEAFLMKCISTYEPREVYNEVWENSYSYTEET